MLPSNKYYRVIDDMKDVASFDMGYLLFKWLCVIYVWNYKIYKIVKRLFERTVYQEPFEPHWVNFLQLQHNIYDYKNSDSYFLFDSLDVERRKEYYKKYCESQQNKQDKKSNTIETLFVMKTTNQYICKVWNEDKQSSTLDDSYDDSNVEFLLVEYNHPDMKDTIELDIPSGFYVCNNELLSAAFVLRLLEKQSQKYIYDDRYYLTLLDQNMEKSSLTIHNYIELEKKTFDIKQNKVITNYIEYEKLQKELDECETTFFPSLYFEIINAVRFFTCFIQIFCFFDNLMQSGQKVKRIANEEREEPDEEPEEEPQEQGSDKGDHSDTSSHSHESESSHSFEIVDNKNI